MVRESSEKEQLYKDSSTGIWSQEIHISSSGALLSIRRTKVKNKAKH